ncbi:MAG: DUF927 domain-containing protein [Oscillospiraceae bacterium]|nr:DUF927 domain-containing protein [Oscillospiraceae bacterium]
MLKALDNHFIYDVDEVTGEVIDENKGGFCEEIAVTQRYVNLLTSAKYDEIALWVRDKEEKVIVPRSELYRKIPDILFQQGLSVADDIETRALVHDYLLDTDTVAPDKYYHTSLGFADINGERVYLADTPIGLKDPLKAASQYFARDFERATSDPVSRPKAFTPRGSLEEWKNLMSETAMHSKYLQLAISISLSAPIAHLLREMGVYAEVPIWTLVGESSTGKTTVLKLMAAVYGLPLEGVGLVKDINCTVNAFYKQLGHVRGGIQLIDEGTAKTDWKFSRVIYNLAKGVEPARCNSNSELKERVSFSGAIVISSEESFFGKNTTQGNLARVVELSLPWTQNADHAHMIVKGIRKAYGTAGPVFIENLLKFCRDDPEQLEEAFEEELDELKRLAGQITGVEDRNFNMYATVLLAAKLGKQWLGLDFHLDELRDLLIENHRKTREENDLATQIYFALLEEIGRNSSHFLDAKKQIEMSGLGVWGVFDTRKGQPVIWVGNSFIEDFVERRKFSSFLSMRSEMVERGMLVMLSGGHYLEKHKLGKTFAQCYCVIPPAAPVNQSSMKKTVSPSQTLKNLLVDDS